MDRVLGVLLVLWLAAAGSAAAADFQISPVKLVLEAGQRSAQLNLSNTGDQSLLIQIDPYAWSQSDGGEHLHPTQALVINPPVLNIPAGGQQVVRIGLRRYERAPIEQAYRLMVAEVPTEEDSNRTATRIAARLSLPLFVRSASGSAEPALDIVRAENGLQLHNRGTAHLKLRSLRVRAEDGSWHSLDVPPATYVLPGASRYLPLPMAAWAEQRLQIEAQTENDVLWPAVVPDVR